MMLVSTVDRSELPKSPVEVGSFYLPLFSGLINIQTVVVWDFFHQPYYVGKTQLIFDSRMGLEMRDFLNFSFS